MEDNYDFFFTKSPPNSNSIEKPPLRESDNYDVYLPSESKRTSHESLAQKFNSGYGSIASSSGKTDYYPNDSFKECKLGQMHR